MCVYFSAKLPVLPEEREVGVLIYGSAAEAVVRGAVWEGCNTILVLQYSCLENPME